MLTQQKCMWHCEQIMWLHPLMRWMREPQPGQGFVWLVIHPSSMLRVVLRSLAMRTCHSRACRQGNCRYWLGSIGPLQELATYAQHCEVLAVRACQQQVCRQYG